MSAPPAGGFSLFPNPSNAPRPPSRSHSRPRAATPQEAPASSVEVSPPRATRHTPERRNSAAREGKPRAVSNNPWQHALDARKQTAPLESTAGPSTAPAAAAVAPEAPAAEMAYSQPVTDVPQRCETAFSEAQTLVRSASQRSRSSIAKPPIAYTPAMASSSSQPEESEEPTVIRSIFPRYNPDVPLSQQDSRPSRAGCGLGGQHDGGAPWIVESGQWVESIIPRRAHLLPQDDHVPGGPPTYTLSSSTGQPFYCLRVEPTSASALVTLSRYDPNKPFKPGSTTTATSSSTIPIPSPSPDASSPSPRASSSSRRSNYASTSQTTAHTPSTTALKHQKNWQEVLSTTLSTSAITNTYTSDDDDNDNNDRAADEDDGLVAHLWPSAAARLVADRANDAATVAVAQHESARLVWDADSGSHFLVHPALAVPFSVAVERQGALSRTEYALEHLESPALIARLVRDGTGAGWLEVDTAVAGKVDAVYLVDVVVAALVLVAHLDARKSRGQHGAGGGGGEVFEAPPGGGESKKKGGKGKRAGMEQFEMDLESQSSDLGKEDDEKLPGVLRAAVGLVKITFKCFVWSATLAFKALMAILSGLTRCCGLGKL
ncbi:42611231-4517-46d5-b055-a48cc4eead91 [Thermothielavioides terrestris]|uniref:42611231-4517-46d5-b055-a48cc4eead91 n=1 Tax=Thermothielavioides terrestris TaxID=2587410 RepID=A0A446B8F8_9PEZI|nr:42611231-4517-46d5-b055-a48cc4eead91 [Thermothielavioides terrestris]